MVKKILIIRTLQAELLFAILKKFKNQYPEATFSIITHAEHKRHLDYYRNEFEKI